MYDEISYLKETLDDIMFLLEEIYSRGLISVNNNMLREIKDVGLLCERCGLSFPAISLEKIHKGLSLARHKIENDFEKEAEEILLLGNWVLMFKEELFFLETYKNLNENNIIFYQDVPSDPAVK